MLEATVYGRKVSGFKEDVKAVTYHEADITENEEGCLETVVVFDI
jgi:SHS2 domain-containing protein